MQLANIRQKLAYNPKAQLTAKHSTRTFLNSLSTQYPLALTLTLKQCIEIKNAKGVHYKQINRDDVRNIARHFTHKLNKQVFGSSAKRFGKGLKYLIVVEGERSHKHLHIHMAIGDLPSYVKWNEVNTLVQNAKLSVEGLDEQYKLVIAGDSGWMEYLTKELGKHDTDNVLWDLA
jgi:hypothetical protein